MIDKVKHVSIAVTDQARALAFYRDKLGFSVMTDQDMGDGQRWIELGLSRSDTRVVLFTAPGQEDMIGRFSNVIFGCADVDKTYTELAARGVVFSGPPDKQSWGTSAIFKDSEGNSFCLSSR